LIVTRPNNSAKTIPVSIVSGEKNVITVTL